MSTNREPLCSNGPPRWEEWRRGSGKPSKEKSDALSLMLCRPVSGEKGLNNPHTVPSN